MAKEREMKSMIEYIRRAIHDFDVVLGNLESLNSYYVEISDWIKSKKVKYTTEYSSAMAIKDILDSIYDQEPNQRDQYIQAINNPHFVVRAGVSKITF